MWFDMSPLNHHGDKLPRPACSMEARSHPWWTLTAPSTPERFTSSRCPAPKQVVGDIPAECDRQRSAQGGPGPLCPGHPPRAPFAQVSAAAHLGNPRQEGLAFALCPRPPLPLLPSRVGCTVGAGFTLPHGVQEHTRQPRVSRAGHPDAAGEVGGVLKGAQ